MHPSSTGYPEGDPLSVVAMLAISYTWIVGIKQTCPGVDPQAYADNWEWMTPDVQEAIQALCISSGFAAMLDIDIAMDPQKLKT